MIKKQIRIIAICAAAFIVMIAAYFAVLKPMLDKANQPEAVDIKLLPGEELGVTNRIMITSKVERADMKTVEVKNKDDDFKVIHHLGQNYYYVENAEKVPINQETIASFFTNVGYLLSMERVAAKDIEDGNEILADVSQFGLHPDNPEVYFTVTKTDDSWYKIIIGDKIPTTGGYYVMYEDKDGLRPAIYILDTMMEDTILSTRYSIMLPIISQPIAQNEILYIDNFKFYSGADLLVDIYDAPIPEGSEMLVNPQMRYPAPYIISDKYSMLTSAFLNFTGDKVVRAFSADEIIKYFYTDTGDEINQDLMNILQDYGFDQPTARITFDFKDKNYYFIFSKPNEAGNYYVLSLDFGSIVEISPAKLTLEGDSQPFVQWGLLKFVGKEIFDKNINDVASMVIKVPGKDDAVFTFEGTGQDIKVTGNGKDLIVNKIGDDDYFRGYYYSMLSIQLEDYGMDIYKNDDLLLLETIITMKDGTALDYKFYFVEDVTRRSFFKLNGSGDFYVNRDKVMKLRNDTELVLQNQPIAKDAPE